MANINFLSDSHNVGHVGIGVEPTSSNMLIVKSVSDLTSTENIALFETDTSDTRIRLKATRQEAYTSLHHRCETREHSASWCEGC